VAIRKILASLPDSARVMAAYRGALDRNIFAHSTESLGRRIGYFPVDRNGHQVAVHPLKLLSIFELPANPECGCLCDLSAQSCAARLEYLRIDIQRVSTKPFSRAPPPHTHVPLYRVPIDFVGLRPLL